MNRRRFLTTVGGAVVAAGTAPAVAQSGDPAGIALLADNLLIGSDPPWTGALEGGFYTLTNTEKAGAIYIIAAKPMGPRRATQISVDAHPVPTPAAEYAVCGLVLGWANDSSAFTIVGLGARGEIDIYARDGGNVDYLATLQAQGLRNDVVTRLAARATPAGLEITTNGQLCGSLEGMTLAGGRAGIAAVDRGSFYFANFLQG